MYLYTYSESRREGEKDQYLQSNKNKIKMFLHHTLKSVSKYTWANLCVGKNKSRIDVILIVIMLKGQQFT